MPPNIEAFERAVRRAERAQVVSEVVDLLAEAWGRVELGEPTAVVFQRIVDGVQAVSNAN